MIVGLSNNYSTFAEITSILAGINFPSYIVHILIHPAIIDSGGELNLGNVFLLLFGLLVTNV